MDYFKKSREFLEKYLSTNPELKKMSPNEAYNFETLCGQVKFDEVWTEKDFQVLDAEIGVKAQNAYLQDMSDIKLYFMNRVIDLAKTGLVTKTEIRKAAGIKTTLKALDQLAAGSDSFRCKAEQYERYDDGSYHTPYDLNSVCRARMNLLLQVTDTVVELDKRFTEALTKILLG